jgi:hypothetical protein
MGQAYGHNALNVLIFPDSKAMRAGFLPEAFGRLHPTRS